VGFIAKGAIALFLFYAQTQRKKNNDFGSNYN